MSPSVLQRSFTRAPAAPVAASLVPSWNLHHHALPSTRPTQQHPPQRLHVVTHAAPPGPAAAVAIVAPEVLTEPTVTVAPPVLPPIREITPEYFYTNALDPQEPGIVVVDFYASWCGPCTIMLRELEKMQKAFPQVRFYKLNCSLWDKDFASTMRIRSLPTIKVYHRGRFLEEVTGAKPIQLRQALAHYSLLAK